MSEAPLTALGLWDAGRTSFHTPLSPEEAKRMVREAWREGVRHFDTAWSYTDATSILSGALRGRERTQYSVWSKVMPVPTLKRKAEAELRRLGSDYIDILFLHWPAEGSALFSALKEMEKLEEEGKALAIGAGNFPFPLLEKCRGDFDIGYHERALSLLWSKDWEKEKECGIRTVAYAPSAFGLLGGRYSPSSPPSDERRNLPALSAPSFPLLLGKVKEIAEKKNSTPYAVSLSWTLSAAPWAVVRGGKDGHFHSIPIPSLSMDEMDELSLLAKWVTEESGGDNPFGHRWETS